jgi:putative transposase
MCAFDRRPRFADAATVEIVRGQLLAAAAGFGFSVVAYTFMPDHLHVVLEGDAEDADLPRFARAFRRRATLRCWTPDRVPLWQDGFHERVLREGDDVARVIDYVLNNPVRAGLVEYAVDYPFGWSVTTEERSRL